MTGDIPPRPDTTTQIVGLARFAIKCTLGMAAVLLVADFLGRGWSQTDVRFLSERVLMTFVYGIAAEVIVAIVATTYLALRKGDDRDAS